MVTLDLFRNTSDARPYRAGSDIPRRRPGRQHVRGRGRRGAHLGERQGARSAGPGGVFGEIALIDNGPRSADAVAATDCRVVPVDENWFKFLVQQTPFFSLQIMRVMADRLRRTHLQQTPPGARRRPRSARR